MPGHRRQRRLTAGVVAIAALVTAACDGESERTEEPESIEAVADAYVAALGATLPPVSEADDPIVVYVWQFAEPPLSLDDQVVVIDSLAEQYDVRFVDAAAAAVDPDVTLVPPRDDGLLVGLGPVTVDAPHTMRVERYINEDVIDAFVLTLVRRGDAWSVTSQEPVDPEVLGAVV